MIHTPASLWGHRQSVRPLLYGSSALLPVPVPSFRSLAGWGLVAANLALALAYYLTARFGLQLQFEQTQATPVWPPTGIAIAMIFLAGYRIIPGVALGAFCANLADFQLKSGLSWTILLSAHPAEVSCSLLIAAGNTAEAWLAGLLLQRLLSEQFVSETLRAVLQFTGIVLGACAISASVGVSSLAALGFLRPEMMSDVWLTWWVGDVVGALILAPLLIWLVTHGPQVRRDLWSRDGMLAFGLTALAGGLCFLSWGEVVFFTSEAYLIMPLLMFVTLRYGTTLSLASVFVVSAMAIWGTTHGSGPFVRPDPNVSLVLLQGFIGVVVISLMLLDALHRERQKAINALTLVNANLEELVQQRTIELERSNRELVRSNKELDDFAYIASHDLKEPLRGVENQLAFLVEDYGSQLSTEVKQRLDRLPPILHHLENLIGTLLHYSRVGRVDLAMTDVDLDNTLDEILRSLEGRIEQEKVEVRRPARLPVVRCDQARIGELFRNLITNAIKYNDKPQRWIEIGCDASACGPQVFYVRDNGIGIREQHLDRIFHIFKRLHAPGKFGGGTGAGMTICKKIVERHGGRIWVKSSPGEGSTFYFTLAEDSTAARP